MKKKDEYVKFRASREEKNDIRRKALKRGLTVSEYARVRCLEEDNKGNFYDRDVQMALEDVCDLLYNKVEEHCEDKEFVEACKKGAERIWQCL